MHHPTDRLAHYTSHGALAGTRSSSMGPLLKMDPSIHHTMNKRSYDTATCCSLNREWSQMNLRAQPVFLCEREDRRGGEHGNEAKWTYVHSPCFCVSERTDEEANTGMKPNEPTCTARVSVWARGQTMRRTRGCKPGRTSSLKRPEDTWLLNDITNIT